MPGRRIPRVIKEVPPGSVNQGNQPESHKLISKAEQSGLGWPLPELTWRSASRVEHRETRQLLWEEYALPLPPRSLNSRDEEP